MDLLRDGTSCIKQLPPRDAAVLAPFVKLVMTDSNGNGSGSNVEISVGNESAPQNGHHAVIREFEFGYTEKPTCRLVIHDEQGSSFVKFMENLLKDFKCSAFSHINNATIEFGWIKTNCENATFIESSGIYYMMINHVVCNFDGGKLMYELELVDLMDRHAEGRVAKCYGDDGDQGMYLTDAIREMLTDPDYPPSVGTVKFLRLTDGGNSTEPIRFKDHEGDPERGPKGKWICNNLDKLNTVMSWLSKYVTENDKSFIMTYGAKDSPDGAIIIWEDPKTGCDENVSLRNCIGKYIVNGGRDSRVISFNPNFKFTFVNLASAGGTVGTTKINSNPADQSKNAGHDCPTLSRATIKTGGAQLTHPAGENQQNKFSDADIQAMKSQNKQLLAYFDAATSEPINADLVIIGDPSMPTPLLNKFRPISIVFINPYHLFPSPEAGVCGDWLAAPFFNEVLTNKSWLVKGVTHQISEGKFTTTINIFLPAPGVHLDVGQPFGGSGSGGWQPPTGCR